jgi:CheY-like chemotaxis protein
MMPGPSDAHGEVRLAVAKRVVVVDDDADVRRLLEAAFAAPEFDARTFADPRDALMKLHDIAPDLIVCDVLMQEMDGRTFLQVVKRSQALRDVPFIFLSGIQSTEQIVQSLESGADDFVTKPFELRRLVAKIRAMLRMADRRASGTGPTRLEGPLTPAGALPLLKFCEDSRLTGRLVVHSNGGERWADFRGGDLFQAGGSPEVAGEDPLGALLATEGGTYRIEQRPLDADALLALEARSGGSGTGVAVAGSGAVALPPGRTSTVDANGETVQIQTEGENKPTFTITTVVIRDGQVVRKSERSWDHPLQREDDLARARADIDRQHELLVETAAGPAPGGPAASATAAPIDPDRAAALMAWTLSFVAEAAQGYLGAVTTVALLRKVQRRLASENPAVGQFEVSANGRVVFNVEAPPAVTQQTIDGMAGWAAGFLAEAKLKVEREGGLSMRRVTHVIESELDRVGFYSAFESAHRAARSPRAS